MPMKPLVLTSLSGAALMRADFADQVIMFTFRFVWGKLPSLDDLVTYVAPWSETSGRASTGRTLPAGGAETTARAAILD
jgi:hypothetical protein